MNKPATSIHSKYIFTTNMVCAYCSGSGRKTRAFLDKSPLRGRKFYLFFLLAFWQSSDKSELIKKKIILQVLENKPGHFL